jgi:hypothetical protein
MKSAAKIILLLVFPLMFAAAEGVEGAPHTVEAPFLFQIIPFLPLDDIRLEADVNIAMVAAAVSSVNCFQFAVGACFAEEVEGLQVSGVFNYTDRLNGTQLGIFNRAGSGDGCQIGVFNFSDDADITSIGLFNFHKDSWMDVLLFVDSVCGVGAAYQSGIGGFYSCYSAGVMKDANLSFVSSLTVGTRLAAGIFFMDVECGIFQRDSADSEVDISALLRIKGGLKIFDVFSLFIGAGGQAGTNHIPESAVVSASNGGVNFHMSFFGGAAISIKS